MYAPGNASTIIALIAPIENGRQHVSPIPAGVKGEGATRVEVSHLREVRVATRVEGSHLREVRVPTRVEGTYESGGFLPTRGEGTTSDEDPT